MPVLQRLSAASPTGRSWLMAGILFAMTFVVLALLAFVPALLHPDALLSDLGRDSSLTGRLPLWAFAMDKFHEKPLAGWGFDSLMSVLSTSDFGYGQLHNGYLDLLVRGGAIGLLLALVVVLRTLYLAVSQLRHPHRVAPALLTLILAILLHNITESSLFRASSVNSLLIVMSYTLLELYALSPVVLTMSPLHETRRRYSTHTAALPNFLR
jgi:exopolysaccharide production protein ExoQ